MQFLLFDNNFFWFLEDICSQSTAFRNVDMKTKPNLPIDVVEKRSLWNHNWSLKVLHPSKAKRILLNTREPFPSSGAQQDNSVLRGTLSLGALVQKTERWKRRNTKKWFNSNLNDHQKIVNHFTSTQQAKVTPKCLF